MQELTQNNQIEVDNKDGRNSVGSKDIDKRPIESIEPNREREPLFILLEL